MSEKDQQYDSPTIVDVGTVDELTAGPVTPWAEDPSGQKSTHNVSARAEDE
jgi:hypothetical protein